MIPRLRHQRPNLGLLDLPPSRGPGRRAFPIIYGLPNPRLLILSLGHSRPSSHPPIIVIGISARGGGFMAEPVWAPITHPSRVGDDQGGRGVLFTSLFAT